MERGNSGTLGRQVLAVLLGLTTVIAAPLGISTAAAAAPSAVGAHSLNSPVAYWTTAESPAEVNLRTTRIMAAVAIATLALVGLWWYLVARHRRRD
jgi:hypothetical protein